jgi:hypothetical protein
MTSSIFNKTTPRWIVRNETGNDEIRITGSIRVGEDVTLTTEPGTTVSLANSNDQHSGRSFDGEYIRKQKLDFFWGTGKG